MKHDRTHKVYKKKGINKVVPTTETNYSTYEKIYHSKKKWHIRPKNCIRTYPENGCAVAEGTDTTASGFASHAEGVETTASGDNGSHAEGFLSTASGVGSHAEGGATTASGIVSHAEGELTIARGNASHAEGFTTTASALASHAEGYETTASGDFGSHAEGYETAASGVFGSHAEGYRTTASGNASHAEGDNTRAEGVSSHAEGLATNALDTGAHIMGSFGDTEEDFSWFLANGTSPANKGLAAKILNNGEAYADVGWFSGGADYAELFETADGKSIETGYFVTLEGDKIRKATQEDDYVLGVISANSGFVGNSGEFHWQGKYSADEWGNVHYKEVKLVPGKKEKKRTNKLSEKMKELLAQNFEGKLDTESKEKIKELYAKLEKFSPKARDSFSVSRPVLNPDWKPEQKYVPRLQRPEWCVVGLMGQMLVRDDGTCHVDGYCQPNAEGVATHSTAGYRVMKRVSPNQVLVLFK
ncbi:peptidase G2 autoproteolytic cleavage domain-containing protein [Halobacillus massiliensis]|uniref:peptidase G2 autoproteolytic cleavage domain-containing protein n=1 Tax=Halobacillus massiliensis TaxID=1926286 RepID=UPI0009E359C2|nr:peptidase G2 autoproteolytic cleavage domain-containing protein [Halobacillus massiliensis]